MPTDAIVIVLIVAIVANLVIMALLVVNLASRRRSVDGQPGPNAPPPAEFEGTRLERALGEAPEVFGRPTRETLEWTPTAPHPEPEPEPFVAPIPVMAPQPPEPESSPIDLLVDPITGLESHFAWDRAVRDENNRLKRYGRPYTMVIAELDGLDRLADRVGAEAAGRIIPAVGAVMRRQARACDHVARAGPARFHVLLPETDEVRAINYVERVRSACDVWLQAGAVALQLSFGWSSPGPEADSDAALLVAEERLQAELTAARRRALAS